MNFLGVCKRNVGEVKEKWRGMVSNAKKEQNQLSMERKKTGGGIEPASPKRETRRIIEFFGEDPSFSGISEGIESSRLIKPLLTAIMFVLTERKLKRS